MKITKELLLEKGWSIYHDDIMMNLSDEDKKELERQGIQYKFEEYVLTVFNSNHDENKGFWFLTMRYDLSNTIDRDWSCHIDNNCRESVACVDIDTTEHFNKLMDLMDIEYRM